MDPSSTCRQCGATLPSSSSSAYCAACLLKSVLEHTEEIDLPKETWEIPDIEEMIMLFPEFDSFSFLARGGMGAVYKARQINLNRWIAIKVLPPEIGRQPLFASRFQREAEALASLNHPGIVTIHDFGVRSEFYFFVMEYVPGDSLATYLKQKGELDFSSAQKIMLQLCNILSYAHQQGILHCDLKPENIFFSADSQQVKLMDFGISQMLTDEHKDHIIAGTPSYMAPELLLHHASPTPQSDVYALGVIFYQMLAGKLPSSFHQCYLPSDICLNLPAKIPGIIVRALSIKPEKRYANMDNFAKVIRSASSSSSLYSRHPYFLYALGSLMILLGIVSGIFFLRTPPTPIIETPNTTTSPHISIVEVSQPWQITLPGNLAISLMPVKAGNFIMGSNQILGYFWEQPEHRVVISNSFWVSQYEITQIQYQTIMGENPSHPKGYNLPANNMTWEQAQAFCKKLNQMEEITATLPNHYEFRLPTEAEWEFIAGGGDQGDSFKYAGSNTLNEVAWSSFNTQGQPQPIGQLKPNRLQLFDLTGNVAEWCMDYYSSAGYSSQTAINPCELENHEEGHTARGGHVQNKNIEDYRRVSRSTSQTANPLIGFRIVLAPAIH